MHRVDTGNALKNTEQIPGAPNLYTRVTPDVHRKYNGIASRRHRRHRKYIELAPAVHRT